MQRENFELFFLFFFAAAGHSFSLHFSFFLSFFSLARERNRLAHSLFSVKSLSPFLEAAMTTRSSRGPGGATAAVATAPHVVPPTARRPDGGSGSESSDYDDDEAVFEAAAVRAGAAGALFFCRS